MAVVSGAFSSYPSLLSYAVYADEIATNIAANQSTVRVRAFVNFSGSSASSYSVSGTTSAGNWNYGYMSFSGAGSIQVFSYDFAVNHNADGSGSYSFSGTASSGGWGSASTGGGTLTLTNFDRSAGLPGTMTAAAVTGVSGRIDASWGASTSYISPVTYYHSYRSSSNGGVSYGSWSSESTTTNTYASYTSLTPGLTYQFRVRAYNGQDNYSGYRESNTVFLVAGGKRYFGPNPVTDWALTAAQAKRWTGSAWTSLGTLKRFDGTNWVNLS